MSRFKTSLRALSGSMPGWTAGEGGGTTLPEPGGFLPLRWYPSRVRWQCLVSDDQRYALVSTPALDVDKDFSASGVCPMRRNDDLAPSLVSRKEYLYAAHGHLEHKLPSVAPAYKFFFPPGREDVLRHVLFLSADSKALLARRPMVTLWGSGVRPTSLGFSCEALR